MSVSGVIRGLLVLTGVGRSGICKRLGCTPNAWSAKIRRGSFSAQDLIVLAAALGLRLAFVDEAGRVVVSFPPAETSASGSGSDSGV